MKDAFYSHILVHPECYWWVWPGGRIWCGSASVLQSQESPGGWRRGPAAEPQLRRPPASCCLEIDSERNQQVQCLKEECNAVMGSALTASLAAVETFSWGTEKEKKLKLWKFSKLTKCSKLAFPGAYTLFLSILKMCSPALLSHNHLSANCAELFPQRCILKLHFWSIVLWSPRSLCAGRRWLQQSGGKPTSCHVTCSRIQWHMCWGFMI